MTNQEAFDTINEYLDLYTNKKSFSSSGELLAYQRGILTALLMYLLHDDFFAREVILNRIELLKAQQK